MADETPTADEHGEPLETDTADAGQLADDAEPTQDDADPDADPAAKVRREAKNLRDRLKASEARNDALSRRLHAELVRASGQLADPTDFAYDAEHLDDPDKLAADIATVLAAKPHFGARTPRGDVGQAAKDTGNQPVGLLSHLKSLV